MKPQKIMDNIWVVEHEEYGRVILNTKTQTYTELKQFAYFNYKGKSCRYFESILEFSESESKFGVIAVVCSNFEKVKNRTKATLIDKFNNNYEFYNVERVDNKWMHNSIDGLFKSACYFIILEKDLRAMNDGYLVSKLLIEKGMHETPPSY